MPAFIKMMNVLGELYQKSITSTLLEIYWCTLKGYLFEDIRKAALHHLNHPQEGRFMPKPANFLQYLVKNHKQMALEAWGKVESAIRYSGRYGNVRFNDPMIIQVIRKMGGWGQMCSVARDQVPAIANAFVENYLALSKQNPILPLAVIEQSH